MKNIDLRLKTPINISKQRLEKLAPGELSEISQKWQIIAGRGAEISGGGSATPYTIYSRKKTCAQKVFQTDQTFFVFLLNTLAEGVWSEGGYLRPQLKWRT